MEQPETESPQDKDQALVEKIRSRFSEVEQLIEAMKSKLPDNSK